MKLGGLLKSLAPTIASAAGGPMAGMAVKMAAKKLGLPDTATANEIEDLIEREPDKAVMVREADKDFKNRIREMEIDLESFKTEVEDRKDARENFATDWTPKVFSVLTLLLYGAFVMIVTLMPHDQNDETIISLVLGQLSGILGTAAAFFYGSSSGKK
jgi:hypothetical protein|tara:strand:- start:914 stop:1387 length:474 start_codon:yes stop_codon:yes gene_type:complete